ncbi:MAG TPA: APC family permease [Rhabdochlamydiaceae bacterium]|jgi:amino acid transporter
MNSKISLFPLVLLIVAGIDSIRTLPTTAFFGSSLIFYYLLSAIVFLIPIAFISAEFSSRFPEEGGVFHWVRHAFGERMGFLAVWLQWINTMVWYPTMLVFIAGTATYAIHPALAYNKIFLLVASLTTFWGLTFLNVRGLKVSVRMNSFCGMIGTLLPMCFLIALGAWWFFSSSSCAITFSGTHLLPSFDLLNDSGALVTIMASFLGIELAGVHVSDIANPRKNFPKAVGLSVLILLSTLILGSLAVAVVVPKNDIHFVDGIMQTFTIFLTESHMPFLIPIFALLIAIGSTGGSVNWLLSPAKGLLQVAEYGFLPSFFSVKNSHGVPFRILILQAGMVSIFCFCLQLVPNVNTYYWFLMSLSTGLYMLMYILLFLAALKLKRPQQGYRVPLGMRTASCALGLIACVITIIVGFQPPADMVMGSKINYFLIIMGSFFLMVLPVISFWIYQKRRRVAA